MSCLPSVIIICKYYLFPLILLWDIFSINGETLIPKIMGQCEVKHIMMLPIKTITSVLKVLTYILSVNWTFTL